MRLTKRQLKRIIREEYSKLERQGLINEHGYGRTRFSPTDIFMDIMRTGGPHYWCSVAHEKPGMRCTDYMHYGHALRAYCDNVDPSLNDMPDNIWQQIEKLLREAVV